MLYVSNFVSGIVPWATLDGTGRRIETRAWHCRPILFWHAEKRILGLLLPVSTRRDEGVEVFAVTIFGCIEATRNGNDSERHSRAGREDEDR